MSQRKINTYLKHPDEIRPYIVQWNNQLGASNIAGATWTVSGDDSAMTVNSSEFTAKQATVYLEGGTPGLTYNVENRITRTGDVAALVHEFNVEVVDN